MSLKDERVDFFSRARVPIFLPSAALCSLSHSKTQRWHPAIAVAIPQKYRSDELRLMWKFLPSRDTERRRSLKSLAVTNDRLRREGSGAKPRKTARPGYAGGVSGKSTRGSRERVGENEEARGAGVFSMSATEGSNQKGEQPTLTRTCVQGGAPHGLDESLPQEPAKLTAS